MKRKIPILDFWFQSPYAGAPCLLEHVSTPYQQWAMSLAPRANKIAASKQAEPATQANFNEKSRSWIFGFKVLMREPLAFRSTFRRRINSAQCRSPLEQIKQQRANEQNLQRKVIRPDPPTWLFVPESSYKMFCLSNVFQGQRC